VRPISRLIVRHAADMLMAAVVAFVFAAWFWQRLRTLDLLVLLLVAWRVP
jgi:hypothetical protein